MSEFALSSYGEYSEEVSNGSSNQLKNVFKPVNNLANETSPYLLQQANSPVGWYAWGNEPFELAKREDRPIFLSIGYSSSHWCHVMDKECFNDPEVAELLNDTCIPVKVDREERPDLDALFMEVCKVQNGSGGWPLNILLTPEGRPFFSTTWLPKRTSGQMPGLTDILPRIKWLWVMQREDIERTTNDLEILIKERLNQIGGMRSGVKLENFAAHEAFLNLRNNFDVQWGGFGQSPKFPDIPKLLFLLRFSNENSGMHTTAYERYDAFTMVDITLRRMWRGGIHDHLGGGFSKYANDQRWLVPNFEKLLCDQALLLLTASIAQEVKSSPFNKMMAEDLVSCLTRDFCDDNSYSQGFRTAIDSDTPEGEGQYYLWSENEIRNILPQGSSGLFCSAYAVLPGGNFVTGLSGSQMSQNILYEASTVSELAKRYGLKGNEVGRRLYEARKILLDTRLKRRVLFYDGKILLDWNSLLTGALSRASVVFDNSDWKDIAERTALFLQKSFKNPKGGYFRVWMNGKSNVNALASDYAALLWALMELHKACVKFNSGEKQLNDILKFAQEIADMMLEKFADEKTGGLYLNSSDDPNIFARLKTCVDDTSIPSANALAVIGLNALAHAIEDKKYSDAAKRIIDCFSRAASNKAVDYVSLIVAESLWQPVKVKPVKPKLKPENTQNDNIDDDNNNIDNENLGANQDEQQTSRTRTSRRARPERARRTTGTRRTARTR